MTFRSLLVPACLASVVACGITKSAPKTDGTTPVTSATASALPEMDAQAPVAVVDAGPPAPLAGANFAAQAKTLFRVGACGNDDAVPAPFDKAAVDAYCKDLLAAFATYKKDWVDVAMPFLAKLVPSDAPTTVVYPFGGGDTLGALATYPNALEYTTISLEAAADIRKIDSVPQKQLKPELARYLLVLSKYFEKAHSRTDNLDVGTKSVLPGEILFDLVALAVHGYEPVALRYFRFEADGTVKYVEQTEIDAGDAAVKAGKKKREDVDAQLFDNMELLFRKKGDDKAPLKTVRHVAMNLDDDHLKVDPKLVKHLESKGKVAAMTKAASHLLWSDSFSIIRNYLATHTDWMISDSTGFTPAYAKKMGFVQDTYGSFTWPEPFGLVDNKSADDLRKLFLQNPHTELTFRYGYPDNDHKGGHHGHIVVTRKPKPGEGSTATDAGADGAAK